MTDSSDMTITYKAIRDRARDNAIEYIPELPETNTFEAWQDFLDAVESLDAYKIAYESCEWDWVIYYNRAMELCQAVPSDILCDAESGWHDMGAYVDEQFSLFEFAGSLAAIIVIGEIAEAVEQVKEEVINLAQTQIDNLEQG